MSIPGFSQLDDLTVCGEADTLSLIIYSGALGDIKGFEVELDLPEGINYAGWEHIDNEGTNIFNTDPNKSKPEFSVTGFDGDSLIVVNIGLRANCDVELFDLLTIVTNMFWRWILLGVHRLSIGLARSKYHYVVMILPVDLMDVNQ